MTPPEQPDPGQSLPPREATAPSLVVLRKRADFLRAASARRQGADGFLLQGRDRADGDASVRVGFTASKKIGNAVKRNRAKRRLRALAREVLAKIAKPGWDYVLIARPEATVQRCYGDLQNDLARAVQIVHQGRGR